MYSRIERVPFSNCSDKIDRLSEGKSFIIFTSEHEITVKMFEGHYYIKDDNVDSIYKCTDKESLINRIKKSLKIFNVDENNPDLNDFLKNMLLDQLRYPLGDITKLEPHTAIEALNTMIATHVEPIDEAFFAAHKVYEGISQVRTIFDDVDKIRKMLCHPCPPAIVNYIHTQINTAILQHKAQLLTGSSLNGAQKNSIEGTLTYNFQDIADLAPEAAIKALQAIIQNVMDDKDKKLFEDQGVFGAINEIRNILSHPYPQNRTTSYPYFNPPNHPGIVVYKNAHGKPAYEKMGLLNLTSWNDNDTFVTKEAVVEYIHALVNNTIQQQVKKLPAEKLLHLVEQADYDGAEKMVSENPALIFEPISRKYPNDKFKHISPLRLAFEWYDTHMWKIFLEAIQRTQNQQLLDRFSQQLHDRKQMDCLNLQPLFDAYDHYIKQFGLCKNTQITEDKADKALHNLGVAQRKYLPWWMLKIFCDEKTIWDVLSLFTANKDTRPNGKCEILAFYCNKNGERLLLNKEHLGINFALVRIRFKESVWAVDSSFSTRVIMPQRDLSTFRRLCEMRIEDLNKLKQQPLSLSLMNDSISPASNSFDTNEVTQAALDSVEINNASQEPIFYPRNSDNGENSVVELLNNGESEPAQIAHSILPTVPHLNFPDLPEALQFRPRYWPTSTSQNNLSNSFVGVSNLEPSSSPNELREYLQGFAQYANAQTQQHANALSNLDIQDEEIESIILYRILAYLFENDSHPFNQEAYATHTTNPPNLRTEPELLHSESGLGFNYHARTNDHNRNESLSGVYSYVRERPNLGTNLHSLFSNVFIPNAPMIHALNALNGRLTVAHLEGWLSPRQRAAFTQAHAEALVYLIEERNLEPYDALIRVGDRSEDEVSRLIPFNYVYIRDTVD